MILHNFWLRFCAKEKNTVELDNIVVTKLFNILTIPIAQGRKIQMTDRYGYALTFCATKGGRIHYYYQGETYLSDYDHAVLLPMGRDYSLEGICKGDFPLINFFCEQPLNNQEFAVFELSTPEYYLQTYEQIRNLSLYDRPFCNARAMSLFYDMLSHLMLASKANNPLLLPAVSYMEKNYANPELTVEKIASQAHISVGYFHRMFKEQYSISPKKYILNARMAKAKELLIGKSYLSISEIARECGFTNVYHFDRSFKEHTGCSPTEYIQKFGNML